MAALLNSKRLKWMLILFGITGTTALVVLWLAYQRVPTWYHPHWLTRAEMRRVQQEFDDAFHDITQQLVRGKPFSISLTSKQVNDVLAAQPHLWPAAKEWMSPPFSSPHVRMETQGIRFGLRHRWGQVQSVVSARVTPRVEAQQLSIGLDELRAGGLGLPAAWLAQRLPHDADSKSTAGLIRKMLSAPTGAAVRNHFYWPNGDIPFSVDRIMFSEDRLTLQVQPRI